MIYRSNKNESRKRWNIFFISIASIFLVLLFLLPRGLAMFKDISHRIFVMPSQAMVTIDALGREVFSSKRSLIAENIALREQIAQDQAEVQQAQATEESDAELKDMLGRTTPDQSWLLSAVLLAPSASPYDTMVIDVGSMNDIQTGMQVFAHNQIPIGTITDVFPKTSVVTLYSSPGVITTTELADGSMRLELLGRGGGNFEAQVPLDAPVPNGTDAVLPELATDVVAVVGKTEKDPRDPYQTVFLVSPANAQNLRFVYVAE